MILSPVLRGFSARLVCALLCIFLLQVVQTTFGQTISRLKFESSQTISAEKWQVIDVAFVATEATAQPFEESFSALLAGPDNRTLEAQGFYNGGDEWVLRFSAAEEGEWSFKTTSSLKSLHGLAGQVTVGPNKNPRQRGGLVIHPDHPQNFFYEDGTECAMLAFEADWLFALDYDNPEAAPKTAHLLDLLAAQRINQVVTTVYSYDVQWPKDPLLSNHPEHEFGGRDEIYPFLGTNPKPDFSALNVEFFQRFDRVVSLMNERGITAHLMIYVWNKNVKWPDTESLADNRYFDYVVKRYQAFPNVIWDVSKEALNNARCTEAYGCERIDRIRKLDPYKRLVTVHDGGFCRRNKDKVDIISWQVWSATIYDDMLDTLNQHPDKPVFNIEHGGYESSPYVVFPGDYSDPKTCLRRNWLIHFAGAYSTYYWQGAAWNVIIHNPFELATHSPKPAFGYYRHLIDFCDRFPPSEFKPSRKDNQSAYCLANGKGTYLFYLPSAHEKLSKYGWKKKKGTIQWFNTLTGEYSEASASSAPYFTSPWKGEADSVLIFKTESK